MFLLLILKFLICGLTSETFRTILSVSETFRKTLPAIQRKLTSHPMTATLKDVARQSGYSVTTVSRALNGHDDVNEETRSRIRAAAEALDYSPNLNARQLQTRRAQSLGFIIPAEAQRLKEPFFMEFLSAVASEAAQHDYSILLSAHAPDAQEEDAYRHLAQSGRIGGMILMRARRHDPRVAMLTGLNIPCALFGRTGRDDGCAWIDVDGQAGVHAAAQHLLALGHSRIGHILGPDQYHFVGERQAGYASALAAARVPLEPDLIITVEHMTERDGYAATRRLLELGRPPSALIAVTDLVAMGAMRAVQDAGLRVGKDVAVVGFDGLSLTAYTSPPLTTVAQPTEEIGRKLVAMAVAQIAGDESFPKNELLIPRLIVRESSTGDQSKGQVLL